MFKIVWDKKTGGVRLSSKITKDTLGISPRPVWFEELDILGLNQLGYIYPKVDAPLMWAINKQYYYHGELMFEAKGANIYDPATIVFQPGKEKATLKPVDVAAMLERNKEYMFLLESEALEFIRETFTQYSNANRSVERVAANQLDFESMAKQLEVKQKKKMAIVKEDCDSFDIMPLEAAEQQGKRVYQTTKIDRFIASFSGGKDSQVVLDLCTRAIPSNEFEVIYSDTGYELPTSLALYEQVQQHYKSLFPDLRFSIARNHESVLNYWDKIGTPSDKHRWCCSVMKTAPLYRMLKVDGSNKQAKPLAFEGVRTEESATRSNYLRIGKGVKHGTVINARPILHWNTTEVFLYLFERHLDINLAYRFGKPRVGCLICPFSSPWDDMIVNKTFKKELDPFLTRLVDWAKQRHIPNLDEYIKEHKWKLRASGNNVSSRIKVNFKSLLPTFKAHVINPQKRLETWLPVLCDYTISNRTESETRGELRFKDTVYSFVINNKDSNYTFTINDIKDPIFVSLLKRVIYKNAYCINCEACEVECPSGALSVYPQVVINKQKCIHCHKCLQFHDNGCIVADSLIMNTLTNAKGGGISRIGTFGIHDEWLQEFFADSQSFWDYNSLGNKQEQSFKAWLVDAGIIDNKKNLTEFGSFCVDHHEDESDLIWELIWVNFAYNSTLTSWFINTIRTGQLFSKTMLDELAINEFDGTKNTITYAIGGFMQIFNYSPIGDYLQQGIVEDGKTYMRRPHSELTETALAYSIYKYAESKGVRTLRVSDFYQEGCMTGPAKEFGITKTTFERLLRQLNSANNRVLIAELNMGLDSITLREDLTPILLLKELVF